MGYFGDIRQAAATIGQGMRLTWRHLRRSGNRRTPMSVAQPGYFAQPDGLVTIQYPREQIPVPDVGRYRLHMETEDCIVCDQCARICPVDCITIEKVKAVEDLGATSDGSRKRFYLPTFDIDMAKCCYCGLCTVVCPTECLLMTKVYDYAEYDRENFIYHFGNLSPEETRAKEAELEAFEAAKREAKAKAAAEAQAAAPAPQPTTTTTPPPGGSPPPGIKPPVAPPAGIKPPASPPAGTKPPVAPPPGIKPPASPPTDIKPPAGLKPPIAPPPGIKPPPKTEDTTPGDSNS